MPIPHFLFLGTGAALRKIHPFLGATQPPHKKEIAAVQAAGQTVVCSQIGCRRLIYGRK